MGASASVGAWRCRLVGLWRPPAKRVWGLNPIAGSNPATSAAARKPNLGFSSNGTKVTSRTEKCARGSTDRAPDYGSGGWGFESLRARFLSIGPGSAGAFPVSSQTYGTPVAIAQAIICVRRGLVAPLIHLLTVTRSTSSALARSACVMPACARDIFNRQSKVTAGIFP